MKGIKSSNLPKALAFINIAMGVLSIIIAIQDGYKLSAVLIILACIAFRYQGKSGLYTHEAAEAENSLGLLADIVSFGTAPSILLYLAYGFSEFGIYGYLMVLLMPIAAAFRLAGPKSGGITPVLAGAIIAVFVLITADKHVVSAVPIFLTAALSYMMVSKYKIMFSDKGPG